jgi:threonine dehydrogenase-like Zn-dependent dehydrogenase
MRRGAMVGQPCLDAGVIHDFYSATHFKRAPVFRTGQTYVQRFMQELLQRIEAGGLKPETIISHRPPPAQAVDGYRMFDRKEDNRRKVVLRP